MAAMLPSASARWALGLSYRGTAYKGWQSQPAGDTVQDHLERALSTFADEPVSVVCAGRTDAGVHALAQVIHFDTGATRNEYSWVRGVNTQLSPDVALLWAGPVSDSFHARYSATGRHYHYVIFNRPIRPTHLRGRVTWEYRPLDVLRMQVGATQLIGTHDFTSFRAVECQSRSPVRELRALTIERRGEFVHIRAYANAFLQHMVRNIAGVLMTIGAGEREPAWAREVLEARDRRQGGVTAASDGLYLTEIEYPDEYSIPWPSRDVGLW
jgi:tRNA pseudouridine38-40 synthase